MTIPTRQQAGNTATGTSTTPSVTLTTAPVAGNLLTLVVSSGQGTSSFAGLLHAAGDDTNSDVHIYYRVVQAGDSATWSITLAGSTAWDARLDEWTGAPGGWVLDLAKGDHSGGAETSHAITALGQTRFPSEVAVGAAGFNISEASVPWNLSLTNDSTNLLNGTRSLTVASRVLTGPAVDFSTLSVGAWSTSTATGGFAFATFAAIGPPGVAAPLQLVLRPGATGTGIELPVLGPLFFKNTNPVFGTSAQTLGAFAGALAGSATSPQLPQINAGLLYVPPATGVELGIIGPAVFQTRPVTGTSAQTLGAFTGTLSGSATAPQLPEVESVLLSPAPGTLGVQLAILGPPLFKNTNPVIGASSQTLGSFTDTAQGSATQPQLPQLQALLLEPYPPGIQLPVVGPAFFTSNRPVTGTGAQTLGAFTSNAQGSATQPQLPQIQAILLYPPAAGVELPLVGPSLFVARISTVAGTSATTLGTFTGTGQGSTAAPQLPQLQLLAAQPLGVQPPLLGPAFFGPRAATVTGTSSQTLGSFTNTAQGSATQPTLPQLQVLLLGPSLSGVQPRAFRPYTLPTPTPIAVHLPGVVAPSELVGVSSPSQGATSGGSVTPSQTSGVVSPSSVGGQSSPSQSRGQG